MEVKCLTVNKLLPDIRKESKVSTLTVIGMYVMSSSHHAHCFIYALCQIIGLVKTTSSCENKPCPHNLMFIYVHSYNGLVVVGFAVTVS